MTGRICRAAGLVLLASIVPVAGCGRDASQPTPSVAPSTPEPEELSWVPFTLDAFAEHRSQGHTLLVDFTADW